MARTGGTIFKDKDGKVTDVIAPTQPAGTPPPSASPRDTRPDGAGGAAGDGDEPDRPSPAATKPKGNPRKPANGTKKGNGK